MHLFYIDDSHERNFFAFCALGIPDNKWKLVFNAVRDFRTRLRQTYGIYLWKELHAWKFISGRGQPSDRRINIPQRCDIYREILSFIASQAANDVLLFGATSKNEEWAFERLLNRINRTMQAKNSYAVLYCDEGNEPGFTALTRRLAVFNYIPSRYGAWLDTGEPAKNIPTERLLEDPVFKPSHKSYLIQLADSCAYSLLRKERPLPAKSALGLDKTYEILEPVCFKAANYRDRFGIVRD